jgi:hypothetical protein
MDKFYMKDGRFRLTEGNVLEFLRTFNAPGMGKKGGDVFLELSNENPEFHEPDKQEMTYAYVHGDFDNALCDQTEAHIILKVKGKGVVCRLNLCLLLALAADRIKAAQDIEKEIADLQGQMGF